MGDVAAELFALVFRAAGGPLRRGRASGMQALRFGQEANDDVGTVCTRLNLVILRASRGALMPGTRGPGRRRWTRRDTRDSHSGACMRYLNLGDLERLEGNYHAALSAYHRGIDAAERVDNAHACVAAQSWIGLTLASHGSHARGHLAARAASERHRARAHRIRVERAPLAWVSRTIGQRTTR